jgi:magnesium-transporting ATPase (P-type)
VYSGSLVVRGHGRVEVTATGARSEIGKIGLAITRIDTEPSRLRIQTRRLVCNLAALSLSLSELAVFLYGFWRGGWLDPLLSGIALGKCRLVPKSIQTIHSSTREPMLPQKNSATPAKAGAHRGNGSRPSPGSQRGRRGIESSERV